MLDNGDTNFNQQIAILFTEDSILEGPNTRLDIYTVDPAKDDFTPAFKSVFRFDNEILLADDHRVASPLQAGDFQGRSLALGPPQKIKISGHIQPNVVLDVPPMHVDYIRLPSDNAPTIVNVSVAPDIDEPGPDITEFSTTYAFASGTTGSTTQQSDTSTTASTKTDVDGKVSFGIP